MQGIPTQLLSVDSEPLLAEGHERGNEASQEKESASAPRANKENRPEDAQEAIVEIGVTKVACRNPYVEQVNDELVPRRIARAVNKYVGTLRNAQF